MTSGPAAGPSRRQFLVGAAAAGAGLTVGFHVPLGPAARALAAQADAVNPINAYLRIAPDGTVTVLSAHMDGGQGIYTGIATLVAEELDADWSQVRVEGAAGNPKLYGNLAWGGTIQGTGGSPSTASSWERYRQAGAIARAMLVQAAAETWDVPADEIRVEKGVLSHASGKSASFGELADRAARSSRRPRSRSRTRRPGSTSATRSCAGWTRSPRPPASTFPIDVRLPGMLTAVLARPPLFGATVRSFDAAAARQVKGVVDVVETPRGVAVVAQDTWSAIKGRDRLTVEWDESAAEKRGTAELMAEYRALAQGDAAVARREGDVDGALAGAAKVIEAEFEFPYLAHAAMEPLDAVARYRERYARDLGRAPDARPLSGGQRRDHGHRPGEGEAARDDAGRVLRPARGRRRRRDRRGGERLKAIGAKAPVKVLWTREDDMTGGRYRPMYYHQLKAGLDAAGRRSPGSSGSSASRSWPARRSSACWSRTASTRPRSRARRTCPTPCPTSWSTWSPPRSRCRCSGGARSAPPTPPTRPRSSSTSWRRRPGRTRSQFRRALLHDHPRHRGVLDLVADKAGWGTPLPAGRFRGVAVHESFGTYVAQVAEISLKDDGGLKVERVVCAVDCGIAVNPDIVRAQMEGGIGFGLGAILKSEITLEGGQVQQTNFDRYQMLTIDEMPEVEVHIVPSTEAPTGVGEPGVPPIGPAVANAVFAATGKRVRVLPFSRHDFRSA